MNFHRFGMPVAVSIDKKVIFFAFPEQHDILLSASDFGVWVGVRVRAGESTHPSPITIEYQIAVSLRSTHYLNSRLLLLSVPVRPYLHNYLYYIPPITQQCRTIIRRTTLKNNSILIQINKQNIYSQMSCYCKGHQLIRLCICCQSSPCSCQDGKNVAQNDEGGKVNRIVEEIQKNFANLLEKQLQKLSEQKQNEIHDLEVAISKLKSQIMRLQNRNKLDKDNENRLKQQVRKNTQRIKQLEDALVRQQANTRIKVESSHKLTVEKRNDSVEQPKIITMNAQVDGLRQQLAKLRGKIFQLEERNKDLAQRLERNSQQHQDQTQDFQKQVKQLQSQLQKRTNQIDGFKNEKAHLSEKIEILLRPVKTQKQPIIVRQLITNAPEIRTVYVDRPIEKTKIVEVERVVKQFIQPERPVVNRIIQCPPSKACKCNSDSSDDERTQRGDPYEQQRLRTQYDGIVHSYKQERQKLLRTIINRDSDYKLLEKKVQLCQKMNANQTKNRDCQGSVDVQVTILKDGVKPKSESSNQDGKKPYIQKQSSSKFIKTDKNTKKR